MIRRSGTASPFRLQDVLGVALTPAAALAVHELRYRLAFGSAADGRLHAEGHDYLELVLPVAVLVGALAAGAWLVRAARCWCPERDDRSRWAGIWALATALVLAIYAGQELAEGALVPGHPAGLEGVLGHGGVWALPSAVVMGGLFTLVLRGAAAAGRALAAARPRLRLVLPPPPASVRRCGRDAGIAAAYRRRPRGRAPPRSARWDLRGGPPARAVPAAT